MTKEFQEKIFVFLKNLHSAPKDINSWRNSLNDVELHDLIKFSVDHSLVTGISSELNGHGEVVFSIPYPRLTNSGVQFINDYKVTSN